MNRQLTQAACTWHSWGGVPISRYQRSHDGDPGPCRNDTRRESIGQTSESARVPEAILSRAVGLVDMSARGAFRLVLRGSTATTGTQRRGLCTRRSRAVERMPNWHVVPAGVGEPWSGHGYCPGTPGQPRRGVFGDGNDTLGDDVVRISLIPGLDATERPELTTGRLRAFALEVPATVGIDPPMVLPTCCPTVEGAIEVGSQIDDTQVDTQVVLDLTRGRCGHVQRAVQEERAVAVDEVPLVPAPDPGAVW